MQTLKISRTDDIQRVIEKAKTKFGEDKKNSSSLNGQMAGRGVR